MFDPQIMARWYADKAEARGIRWDFPLTDQSLVYDFGGFTGDWSVRLLDTHPCCVHIFEPVAEYRELCKQRFAGNVRAGIYSCGLSDYNQTAEITLSDSSSSLFIDGESKQTVTLVDVAGLDIPHLVSMNIEGSEYPVMKRMLETNWLPDFIQVQFHSFYPDSERLRNEIRNGLSKTHREIYNYPFVWEAWRRY